MSLFWTLFLDNFLTKEDLYFIEKSFKNVLHISLVLPLFGIISFFNDSARQLIYSIYSPSINTFESVGFVFAGFREPGIFKDYYTASLAYFVILVGYFAYVFKFKNKVFDSKAVLFTCTIIIAEIVTGRTGLYSSILVVFLVFFFNWNKYRIKRELLFLVPIVFLAMNFLFNEINSNTLLWAFEIFSDKGDVSSGNHLMSSLDSFFNYLSVNLDLLIIPLHPENFSNNLNFYSDSFYAQEIIRHGIWGVLIFVFFIIALSRHFIISKNMWGLILVFVLAILNIKGGNTFFLERYGILLWTIFYFTAYKPDKWRI